MPRLVGCPPGRVWPYFGADDLPFLAVFTLPFGLSLLLVTLDCWARVDGFDGERDVVVLFTSLTSILGTMLVVDCLIWLLASRGHILEVTARTHVARACNLRLSLIPLQLLVAAMDSYFLFSLTADERLRVFTDEALSSCTSWVRLCDILQNVPLLEIWFWELLLVVLAQWIGFLFAVLCIYLFSRPEHGAGRSPFLHAMRLTMWLIGARDDQIKKIVQILMATINVSDTDLVPTDMLFGLLLVRHAQKWRGLHMPQIQPRCQDGSVRVPLSPTCAADIHAIHEFQWSMAYAVSIYGWSLRNFGKVVVPGTSLVSPCRAASTCCGPSPGQACRRSAQKLRNILKAWCSCLRLFVCRRCRRRRDQVAGAVGGCDMCRNCSENAMFSSLEEAGHHVELLFGSWKVGASEPPPHCILKDDSLRRVIFVVRGTLSLEECLHDALTTPKEFGCASNVPAQPGLAFATPDVTTRGMSTFEALGRDRSDDDFFAHEGMADCALVLLSRHGEFLKHLLESGGCEGYELICVGHSLGAGIAALMAVELRTARLLSAATAERVKAVCIEPPGGLLSKRLAEQTEDFILSLVTADDWIARLSALNVEKLREEAIEKIARCNMSKTRLAVHLLGRCLRHCCFARPQGGGPGDFTVEGVRLMQGRIEAQRKAGFWAPAMYPPGRIVHLRPTGTSRSRCCNYRMHTDFRAEWVDRGSLNEIVLSMKAVEHHFPNIIEWALKDAAGALVETTLSAQDYEVSVGLLETELIHGREGGLNSTARVTSSDRARSEL